MIRVIARDLTMARIPSDIVEFIGLPSPATRNPSDNMDLIGLISPATRNPSDNMIRMGLISPSRKGRTEENWPLGSFASQDRSSITCGSVEVIGPVRRDQNEPTAKEDISTDRGRPHDGRNPERQYKIEWAHKPADERTQDPERVCKIERAYKPAADQRSETAKVFGPTGQDPESEKKPVKESVSRDHGATGSLPEEMAPRRQENEGGGPQKGQELRGETDTHRACEPDGDFEKKSSIRKRNRLERRIRLVRTRRELKPSEARKWSQI
jgi:hypothetical protein